MYNTTHTTSPSVQNDIYLNKVQAMCRFQGKRSSLFQFLPHLVCTLQNHVVHYHSKETRDPHSMDHNQYPMGILMVCSKHLIPPGYKHYVYIWKLISLISCGAVTSVQLFGMLSKISITLCISINLYLSICLF